VDEEAAEHYGICVRNVSGYATPSVTEHVFALMLALVRRLPDYQRAVLAGRWQLSKQFCLLDFPISELAGRRLGIIGYGELGRAVAVVARAFGMSVIIAARPGTAPVAGRVALEQLLHEADVVSLHCPLTDASRDLIGVKELALMKAGALLINTARGGIVDEQALANALRSGQIGGAAVDVLLTEPPCAGNPLLADDIPNLIITPHIAWASREARQRLVDGVVANIQEWIDKKGLRTED
jgi:glycerate dehydrogenase